MPRAQSGIAQGLNTHPRETGTFRGKIPARARRFPQPSRSSAERRVHDARRRAPRIARDDASRTSESALALVTRSAAQGRQRTPHALRPWHSGCCSSPASPPRRRATPFRMDEVRWLVRDWRGRELIPRTPRSFTVPGTRPWRRTSPREAATRFGVVASFFCPATQHVTPLVAPRHRVASRHAPPKPPISKIDSEFPCG